MPDFDKEATLRRLDAYVAMCRKKGWHAFMGLSEFAEVLGISRQAAAMRRNRGLIPPPDKNLAMGPIWSCHKVRQWIQRQQ